MRQLCLATSSAAQWQWQPMPTAEDDQRSCREQRIKDTINDSHATDRWREKEGVRGPFPADRSEMSAGAAGQTLSGAHNSTMAL